MTRLRQLLPLAAALTLSCRTTPPDPLDSCVPADTIVLAGADLNQLRHSPVYSKLPVTPAEGASKMLLAFNGKELLIIAQGPFRAAPAGWTLVEPGLAVTGSDAQIHAAVATHADRRATKPAVLSQAARIPANKPVWIVTQGGIALPLSGNGENLNPLLAKSQYAWLTLTLTPQVEIDATFAGATDDAAAGIEKTLRGFLELAKMGEKRDAEARSILDSVRIERDKANVRASVSVSPEQFGKLVDSITR